MDFLFDMVEFDDDVGVGCLNPVGYTLGEEHRAMLSASTSKGDHQVVEMTFQVIVDALAHEAFHVFQKQVGLRLLVQVFDDLPVATCFGLELWLTARVGQSSAIEHETSAVAAEVVGITFPKRETVDGDSER